MRFEILLLAGSIAFAGSGVETPSIGYVRSSDGGMVRVSGIAGAMIVDPADAQDLQWIEYSGKLLVAATDTSLHVAQPDGSLLSETEVPGGPIVAGFDDSGVAVVVWFQQTGELKVYRTGDWTAVPIDAVRLAGKVIAARLEGLASATLLVQRDEVWTVRIRISDGAIQQESPAGIGSGPALFIRSGLLFVRDGVAFYRGPAGGENVVDTPQPALGMHRMGLDWVQLETGSGVRYALRTTGTPAIYVIPEVAQ